MIAEDHNGVSGFGYMTFIEPMDQNNFNDVYSFMDSFDSLLEMWMPE